MKNIIIIILTFFSFSLLAQEEQGEKKSVQSVKSISVEREVSNEKKYHVENERVYVFAGHEKYEREKNIEYYENYIKALKTKIEIIKLDSLENGKAVESGWFIKMNEYIKTAEDDKLELQNAKK